MVLVVGERGGTVMKPDVLITALLKGKGAGILAVGIVLADQDSAVAREIRGDDLAVSPSRAKPGMDCRACALSGCRSVTPGVEMNHGRHLSLPALCRAAILIAGLLAALCGTSPGISPGGRGQSSCYSGGIGTLLQRVRDSVPGYSPVQPMAVRWCAPPMAGAAGPRPRSSPLRRTVSARSIAGYGDDTVLLAGSGSIGRVGFPGEPGPAAQCGMADAPGWRSANVMACQRCPFTRCRARGNAHRAVRRDLL